MLLNRKKNDPSVYSPYNNPLQGSDMPASDIPSGDPNQGPTIALRPMAKPVMADSVAPPELAQQPTIPVRPAMTQGIDMNAPDVVPAATIPLSSRIPSTTPPAVNGGGARDVIQEDRDRLTAAQNKHIPLGKRILEELGTYAASGVGLNLRPILHPGGTDEEKAQRQLADDLGIQKAQTENQDTQSTIALHSVELAKEILKSHPQGFDPNDPADVIAKKKLEDAGIPIPATYGKQPKAAGPPETRTRMEKGVKYQTEFDPESRKFVYSTDANGDRIVVDEAPAEKPEPQMTPNETFNAQKEYETNLAKKKSLQDAATSAEVEGNQHLAARKTADERVAAINAQIKAPGFDNNTPAANALKQERDRLVKESEGRQKLADESFKNKANLLKQSGEIVATPPPKISARKPRPVKPSGDGKYHYTPAQIKAALQPGQSYDDIVKQLKAHPGVIIDQQ